jgi:Icc-related predicted phosphoesterase
MIKIVMISDTHNLHDKIIVPDGDILIHAGDMSMSGKHFEIASFARWLQEQPHKYKVVIAGNHDFLFEGRPEIADPIITETGAIYLNDSGVTIEGLNIWGSPVQPWFYDWAFNRQRGAEIKKHWNLIPANTDVLITHGPPRGILDQSVPNKTDHLGCSDLLESVHKINLKLHVFGHIHGSAGITRLPYIQNMVDNRPIFINASVLNEQYQPNGKQFVVEL